MNITPKHIVTGALFAASIAAIPFHAHADSNATKQTALVNATSLNVRSTPAVTGKIIGKLKQGQTITIIEKTNGWAKIQYNGVTGYVSLEFLKTTAEKPTPTAPVSTKQETGIVNATSLNVRNSPATSGKIIGSLTKNQSVLILEKSNGWAKIQFNGKEAYVSLDFVQTQAKPATPSNPPVQVPSSTQTETASVNATALNVRSTPSTSGSLVGKLKQGDRVNIIGKANGWAKIQFNGKEAYVSLDFLQPQTKPATPNNPPVPVTPTQAETASVNATALNVRSTPSISGSLVGKLKQGDLVTIIGKANGWAKIQFNGKEAYVSLDFLQPQTKPATPNNPPVPVPPTQTEPASVNATALNVRSTPSTSGSLVGLLKQGDSVNIIEKANGWAKIQYNGKEAYVSLSFLQIQTKPTTPNNPPVPVPPTQIETAYVNTTSLNVRKEPSIQGVALGYLKQGQAVRVLTKQDGWATIEYNGGTAFVSLQYLQFTTEQQPQPPIVTSKKKALLDVEVKQSAAYSAKTIGKINKGEEVSIVSEGKDWITIQYQNQTAYISALAFQAPSQEEKGIVNASTLNVRSNPSTSGTIVGKLRQGESVTIINKANGWAKIRFNGADAYVSADFLQIGTKAADYTIVTGASKIQAPNGDAAQQVLTSLQEDGYITSGGNIVNMKSGFVRTNKLVSIYDIKTNSQLTYVAANTDLKFVKVEGDRVHVTIDGKTGYVFLSQVQMFPQLLNEPTSYYMSKKGKLIYYSYDAASESYFSYEVGYAPPHLQDGVRYEAFDKTNVGGKDSYQYFTYMPLRVTSSYTATDIDRFIQANSPNSPLIGLGTYFVQSANKYNINVGYLVSHAILESGWGKSRIAQDKKNLYGFRAIDSDPYNGAAAFKTWQEGIDYCAHYIDANYLTPNSANYNGAIIGDKAHGMNVMYASDENWGQQISSLLHKMDMMYGNHEVNKYQLVTIPKGVTIRTNLAGAKAGVTSRDITAAVKRSIQTDSGIYYELFSDDRTYDNVYVSARDVTPIASY
ncbi:SH3 domain-containing protein [Microbacteriaceae bacterium 4G12]